MKIILRSDIVPSLNKAYAANKWQRATLVKTAHAAVKFAIFEQLGTDIQPFDRPVSISLRVYAVRPRDTDNNCKLILDGIVHAGVLKDDDYKHLPELHIYVEKVSKGHERIEIDIVEITSIVNQASLI